MRPVRRTRGRRKPWGRAVGLEGLRGSRPGRKEQKLVDEKELDPVASREKTWSPEVA